MRPTRLFPSTCALMVAAALSGCGNELSLFPASFANRDDTLRIWAATGTAINLPSAYLILSRKVERIDQVGSFDFAFDIDRDGRKVLLPLATLVASPNLTGLPGLLPTTTPYEQITLAEQLGYITRDTVPIERGDVFFVRSLVDPNCSLGIPYYAKLEVLSFDTDARSMAFRIVSNVNCGYRGLELGIPRK